MGNRTPEQDLQINVVQWLHTSVDPRECLFWATPNETGQGGKRGAILGKIRKDMGVRAGMPDLLVKHTALPFPIGIELKAKTGRQSATQKAIQAAFERQGWPYYICRSVDEVHDALERENMPLRVLRMNFREIEHRGQVR